MAANISRTDIERWTSAHRKSQRYFASVGFTQPACITFCDGRKLK
jgi:hypothetical protein